MKKKAEMKQSLLTLWDSSLSLHFFYPVAALIAESPESAVCGLWSAADA